MQAYADVCWRVLACAGVCWRMLTYADVCGRMQGQRPLDLRPYVITSLSLRMLTYAHVCSRMLTYADVCRGSILCNLRAYDLTVVSRAQIRPEQFTISKAGKLLFFVNSFCLKKPFLNFFFGFTAGVVHIQPPEASQFIPLALWWRRASLFNTVLSLAQSLSLTHTPQP